MYVCIYVSMCTSTLKPEAYTLKVCMYVCLFVCGCLLVGPKVSTNCMHVCIYVSFVCMNVYLSVCMYISIHVCMYICMCVCMHVHMYVCMHVCRCLLLGLMVSVSCMYVLCM